MPRAKLSQIATTWVDEEDNPKRKTINTRRNNRAIEEQLKKKQTFNLKLDTIKRLWMHRVKTDKTLSETMDELVLAHLPAVDLDKKKEK